MEPWGRCSRSWAPESRHAFTGDFNNDALDDILLHDRYSQQMLYLNETPDRSASAARSAATTGRSTRPRAGKR